VVFKDHFSSQSDNYQRYRPPYPQTLFQWLVSVAPNHKLAWDCATGNGQAAQSLAQHFDQVIATDGSEQQIQHARPAANIQYEVDRETCNDLATASVDLITVAQALHWFDTTQFFDEAARVLKPGGVLAVWCYNLLSVNPEVDTLLNDFYRNTVGEYWPPERRLLEEAYDSIPFPFAALPTPDFEMSRAWQREDLIGYLGTWSAVKRYRQERQIDPLVALSDKLAETWPDDLSIDVRWPLAVTATRKPA